MDDFDFDILESFYSSFLDFYPQDTSAKEIIEKIIDFKKSDEQSII